MVVSAVGMEIKMVDLKPELLGRVFKGERPVHVTAEMIAGFCRAVGETNPIHTDPEAAKRGPYGGLVAPPSFAGTFGDGEHIFEQLRSYVRGRLAAGMEVEFVAPIRPGDSITIESHVNDVYEKTGRSGAMVFIVIRSTLKNQNREVVARIDHRFMNRA